MKKILLATAVVFAGTAAMAGNFDANEVNTTVNSGVLSFSLGTVGGELSTVETSATVASYALGRFDTTTEVGLTYGRLSDTLDLSVAYNLSTALNPSLTAYGTAEVSYVAPTADLGAGDAFFGPTVGLTYVASDKVDIFGEVSYAWNMSNSWASQGGAVEVGVDYSLTEQVSVTPSLVRTFNTGADETNAKLGLTFNF
jgi:hypothetical protein